MAEEDGAAPQRKYSRYRSQRIAEKTSSPPPEVPQEPDFPPNDNGVVRSKSRYHRKQVINPIATPATSRPATAQDQDQIVVPPRQNFDTQPTINAVNQVRGYGAQDHIAHRPPPSRQQRSNGSITRVGPSRSPEAAVGLGAPDLRRIYSDDIDSDAEEERRQRLANRYSTKKRTEATESPHRPHTARRETSESVLAVPQSQYRPHDGPPDMHRVRSKPSQGSIPKQHLENDGGSSCFGLFKRKRGEQSPQATEKTPMACPTSSKNEPATIKPGGGGVVPGTDAPISAVNAGDRQVLVECGKSHRIFVVTPTTTPVDLIKSAATVMSERIDVRSAVLLESFGKVGVQRPLRRYEHVRDVMNSWDSDRQNSLLLIDPGTGQAESELSAAGVPKERPEGGSWILNYSQKPGKWDRRMIHLRPDGQVALQKHMDSKDLLNICHMSDFDIYTPTVKQLKTKIKPPKKGLCYAVKSQQKTAMFEETSDYVHVFSSTDKVTIREFYGAIQGWRSWYLVNVMGEGKRKTQELMTSMADGKHNAAAGHNRAADSISSHYQLGSFKPMMDMKDFNDERPTTAQREIGFTKSANQFDPGISPERRTSTRRQQHPQVLRKNAGKLADDEPLGKIANRRASMEQRRPDPEEFTFTGLLGRKYSQRQRHQLERENVPAQPFTNGPSLLNDMNKSDEYPSRQSMDMPQRQTSMRFKPAHKVTSSGDLKRGQSIRDRGRGSIDLQRSGSRAREMPRPLVDLTPQYREPPQHLKKGKAHHSDTMGPGGLIEAATSPEDPLGVPPSTDWRGRNQAPPENRDRTRSISRSGTQKAHRPAAQPEGFTGEGLLASSQQGWGGGQRGRGVMDGSQAKGPMLDLNEPSRYAPGSLLAKVERAQGRDGPIIDRDG